MDLIYLLPALMFLALALLLFSGFPVAWVLGGVGIGFGFIGQYFGVFAFIEFFNVVSRLWGGAAESLILVAVPMFIFMGTMLERSGVANDLLHCLQVLLKRTPGGLALSVTIMGTIMAATTGIIGASVVMMTLMALPVMLNRGYHIPLATGTIAASGTLGILIPPSIMLVIMADLLSISVGTLFLAAILPGLVLAGLYLIYIYVRTRLNPSLAPPLPDDMGPEGRSALFGMVIRSFVPPIALIVMVLGSIFAGWATPTEAAGVGAFGAVLLAVFNRKLNFPVLKDVMTRSGLTIAMIFGIFIGATCFSYVYRSLGGDDLVHEFVMHMGLGSWGLLFLMMGMVFLLGFFFDWIEITLIVLPLFAPLMRTMDFGDHIPFPVDIVPWVAILLAVNLQTSFLTPPFGFALFYMKGVAPSFVKMQQIYWGIIPFVSLQLIGLAFVIAFPALALWLPHYLLD
ncbi:MAG: TRAP transporter large permease subunit [Alphaproteobacteria bacterium]|jgi:tripartite ATP-independent transporter DctM subunit|nr:TRAP transporter large permease subunit [Alphaproteobacteria bacterium]MDP6516937.1 TRAP transporter large permease subunit [Alphaproteobacteria bacterium]